RFSRDWSSDVCSSDLIGDIPFVTTLPKPKRAEALEYYRRIQTKFELNTHLFEEVLAVQSLQKKKFRVTTSKARYMAKHIIVATRSEERRVGKEGGLGK